MGDTATIAYFSFSQWADRVKAESSKFPGVLYEDNGGPIHPFSLEGCSNACLSVMGASAGPNLGERCCTEHCRAGVYRTLGEGTAANWEGISDQLAQRVGTQAHDPAWLEGGPQEARDSVQNRLRLACCSSEVAVLMLRLAVRAACLGGSWYGPWDSVEALQQLLRANALSHLLHALRALLATFGADLAKQYNAINIVSDILHVRRPPCALATEQACFISTAVLSFQE